VTIAAIAPAEDLSVSLADPEPTADGATSNTVTATGTDADGDPVTGLTVAFASTGGHTFGPVTDHGNGTYSAGFTTTTTAGASTITATAGDAVGTTTLTQKPGPATTVAVGLAPKTIPADGESKSTVTATVADAHGNGIAGRSVSFTASGTQTFADTVTDAGDGRYTVELTASDAPAPSP
jgi:hypothetical protein